MGGQPPTAPPCGWTPSQVALHTSPLPSPHLAARVRQGPSCSTVAPGSPRQGQGRRNAKALPARPSHPSPPAPAPTAPVPTADARPAAQPFPLGPSGAQVGATWVSLSAPRGPAPEPRAPPPRPAASRAATFGGRRGLLPSFWADESGSTPAASLCSPVRHPGGQPRPPPVRLLQDVCDAGQRLPQLVAQVVLQQREARVPLGGAHRVDEPGLAQAHGPLQRDVQPPHHVQLGLHAAQRPGEAGWPGQPQPTPEPRMAQAGRAPGLSLPGGSCLRDLSEKALPPHRHCVLRQRLLCEPLWARLLASQSRVFTEPVALPSRQGPAGLSLCNGLSRPPSVPAGAAGSCTQLCLGAWLLAPGGLPCAAPRSWGLEQALGSDRGLPGCKDASIKAS